MPNFLDMLESAGFSDRPSAARRLPIACIGPPNSRRSFCVTARSGVWWAVVRRSFPGCFTKNSAND